MSPPRPGPSAAFEGQFGISRCLRAAQGGGCPPSELHVSSLVPASGCPLSCCSARGPAAPSRGFFLWPVFVTSSLMGAGPVQPAGPRLRLPSLGGFSAVSGSWKPQKPWGSVGIIGHHRVALSAQPSGLFCHRPRAAMPTSAVVRCRAAWSAGHLGPLHAVARPAQPGSDPGARGSRPRDCPSRAPSPRPQAAQLGSGSQLVSEQAVVFSIVFRSDFSCLPSLEVFIVISPAPQRPRNLPC